ncbi:MAG: 3-methylornithine--L-lysine ligase PylC [Anaerovoracaceae bacterium]|jgi:pyrrolysine biosynthesis protein PylC
MEKKYKIVIVGGRLQGMEAVYLAHKAGYHSVLIDRDPTAPASALCDVFICADVCSPDSELLKILLESDLILPAMENDTTLAYLEQLGKRYPLKIAFDFSAYSITSSKQRSDKLFHDHGIPAPAYYPHCKAPYIAKPSKESGSAGVRCLRTKGEVELFLSNLKPDEKDGWIIQEQLAGPSYSIEIIGKPGAYRTYQITQIHMDDVYDCNQVTCPCPVTEEQKRGFEDMAFKIAEVIGLYGIMDLEVIDDEGIFKILEIDARIPSQTPTAIFHSTGVNLLAELVHLFEGEWGEATGLERLQPTCERFASYEHHYLSDGRLQSPGEHIMGSAGPLRLYKDYLGCDEVLTDYREGDMTFRGTFINSGESPEELAMKRRRMMEALNEMLIALLK